MSSSHIISIFAVSLLILILIAYFLSKSKRKGAKPAQRLYLEALKALVSGDDKVAFQRFKQVVTEDISTPPLEGGVSRFDTDLPDKKGMMREVR